MSGQGMHMDMDQRKSELEEAYQLLFLWRLDIYPQI